MEIGHYILLIASGISAIGSVLAALVARAAHRNTKPLGNGWSADVLSRLGRIEDLITNHLEDHAERDLRNHRRGRQ